MEKTNFDLLVEHILNIAEGRKPKQYQKMVIDFEKLESDINALSDTNPFKKIYEFALNGLKSYGEGKYFTNEEMSQEAKTLPEWEKAIYEAYFGHSLTKLEKKRFADRFFSFVKDPDREYFSEYVPATSPEKSFANMEEHIFDYVNESESEEGTPKDEVVKYIGRYGHDESEILKVIDKMIQDGNLSEVNGKLTAASEPEFGEEEPEELNSKQEEDTTEFLKTDTLEDERPEKTDHLDPELAREIGIDPNDPFGDEDYFRSTD